MPVRLTYCQQCARFHRELQRTIARLQRTYPNDLRVVAVECMAACDEPSVAMIEHDFLTQVDPADLERRVIAAIERQQKS